MKVIKKDLNLILIIQILTIYVFANTNLMAETIYQNCKFMNSKDAAKYCNKYPNKISVPIVRLKKEDYDLPKREPAKSLMQEFSINTVHFCSDANFLNKMNAIYLPVYETRNNENIKYILYDQSFIDKSRTEEQKARDSYQKVFQEYHVDKTIKFFVDKTGLGKFEEWYKKNLKLELVVDPVNKEPDKKCYVEAKDVLYSNKSLVTQMNERKSSNEPLYIEEFKKEEASRNTSSASNPINEEFQVSEEELNKIYKAKEEPFKKFTFKVDPHFEIKEYMFDRYSVTIADNKRYVDFVLLYDKTFTNYDGKYIFRYGVYDVVLQADFNFEQKISDLGLHYPFWNYYQFSFKHTITDEKVDQLEDVTATLGYYYNDIISINFSDHYVKSVQDADQRHQYSINTRYTF